MRKIDTNLENVFMLSKSKKNQVCLVEVFDFARARKYFEKRKVKIIKEYRFLNVFCLDATLVDVYDFARMPFVKYIAHSSKVQSFCNVARKIMGVDDIEYDGENICVAIIETGISPHLDFTLGKNRIRKFIDFVSDKTMPYDDNGHGTFVAGVLCGSGLVSFGKYGGFAKNADIISVKALDKNGEATATTILDAIEWIYKNHKKYDIKVVCMSFGSEPLGYNDPIMRGAEKLWNSGIVVVAAAGNSGPDYYTIKSPGISSRIITVGGFDDNRIGDTYNENFFEIAPFSSRGPAFSRIKPDVVAPSVDIVSCGRHSDYVTLSGTSVSAPMIAGICAIILQKYPHLKPDQVKKIILQCSRGITHNRNLEGMGYPVLKR